MLSVECQTCDQEVVGSSLGRACGVETGQVSHTYVPLSPSSVKWYRPKGGDACGWGVKAGIVHVWVAGKTCVIPCYTRVISESFEVVVHNDKALYKYHIYLLTLQGVNGRNAVCIC